MCAVRSVGILVVMLKGRIKIPVKLVHIDGLVQDCCNSSPLALDLHIAFDILSIVWYIFNGTYFHLWTWLVIIDVNDIVTDLVPSCYLNKSVSIYNCQNPNKLILVHLLSKFAFLFQENAFLFIIITVVAIQTKEDMS